MKSIKDQLISSISTPTFSHHHFNSITPSLTPNSSLITPSQITFNEIFQEMVQVRGSIHRKLGYNYTKPVDLLLVSGHILSPSKGQTPIYKFIIDGGNFEITISSAMESHPSLQQLESVNILFDHGNTLSLSNPDGRRICIKLPTSKSFHQLHELVNSAIAALIFFDTFKDHSLLYLHHIERALQRYPSLVPQNNIFYARMKNIWSCKIAAQEILQSIAKEPKSVSKEDIRELLLKIETEEIFRDDPDAVRLHRLEGRLFSQEELLKMKQQQSFLNSPRSTPNPCNTRSPIKTPRSSNNPTPASSRAPAKKAFVKKQTSLPIFPTISSNQPISQQVSTSFDEFDNLIVDGYRIPTYPQQSSSVMDTQSLLRKIDEYIDDKSENDYSSSNLAAFPTIAPSLRPPKPTLKKVASTNTEVPFHTHTEVSSLLSEIVALTNSSSCSIPTALCMNDQYPNFIPGYPAQGEQVKADLNPSLQSSNSSSGSISRSYSPNCKSYGSRCQSNEPSESSDEKNVPIAINEDTLLDHTSRRVSSSRLSLGSTRSSIGEEDVHLLHDDCIATLESSEIATTAIAFTELESAVRESVLFTNGTPIRLPSNQCGEDYSNKMNGYTSTEEQSTLPLMVNQPENPSRTNMHRLVYIVLFIIICLGAVGYQSTHNNSIINQHQSRHIVRYLPNPQPVALLISPDELSRLYTLNQEQYTRNSDIERDSDQETFDPEIRHISVPSRWMSHHLHSFPSTIVYLSSQQPGTYSVDESTSSPNISENDHSGLEESPETLNSNQILLSVLFELGAGNSRGSDGKIGGFIRTIKRVVKSVVEAAIKLAEENSSQEYLDW